MERDTDGMTKQREIVSNWDDSQSVTSENSQLYPLISPLSSVTCLFVPQHLQLAAPIYKPAHKQTRLAASFPLLCLSF